MIISSKGKYGLVALMDICLYSRSEAVTLKSVSKRQDISERYLEQIFSILRKGGIISSKKGAQGGYFLSRKPKDITVGEILNILEGDVNFGRFFQSFYNTPLNTVLKSYYEEPSNSWSRTFNGGYSLISGPIFNTKYISKVKNNTL